MKTNSIFELPPPNFNGHHLTYSLGLGGISEHCRARNRHVVRNLPRKSGSASLEKFSKVSRTQICCFDANKSKRFNSNTSYWLLWTDLQSIHSNPRRDVTNFFETEVFGRQTKKKTGPSPTKRNKFLAIRLVTFIWMVK